MTTSKNSYEHIHPDYRHVLGMTDRERIAFMDQPRWVEYKVAQEIMQTLVDLMNKPKRPRMPNLLIVGDSNNGKTTIIRRFYEQHGKGHVNEDGDPVKPVILAEAPPSAEEKGMYISILERFMVPYRASDPATKLRYQVIHLLRQCHTQLLIFDEFHSLLTGSAIKQREVMNAIKMLCNELQIPIVGVGTKDAVMVLHNDAQHASRFDVVELPVWDMNRDFQKLLAGFERVIPLKQPSKLHLPELANSIHAISKGNTGDVHRLLVVCATEAIKTGKEQITKEILDGKVKNKPTRGIRKEVS